MRRISDKQKQGVFVWQEMLLEGSTEDESESLLRRSLFQNVPEIQEQSQTVLQKVQKSQVSAFLPAGAQMVALCPNSKVDDSEADNNGTFLYHPFPALSDTPL
jgi:hypothetical protein